MALPPAIRRPLEEAGFLAPIAQPDRLPTRPTNEAPEAPPSIGNMISRSADTSWFPSSYLKLLAENDDSVLKRDGGGLKLYDALLDDDVAFSALQQRRMAITSRDWEVTPGDDKDPRSVKAADEFRAMLKEVGFDRVTNGLHYGVWYGYAIAEAVYSIRDFDGRPIVWLSDLIVPDRRWFGFTMEGELRFVTPYARGLDDETLPPNKFIVVRTGGSHDFAFYGLGLAHWAYWPIFFKRSALKFWALYLEKFGMPTVAIGFPETEQNDQEKLDKRLAAAVAVGQDRAVLVPEETLKNDTLKLIEAERSGAGSSSYKDFVGTNDDALIRVILGQTGTSKATPGGLGGDGQAKKDEGVKREIVKADADLISDAIHKLGRWLTTWNHGPDVAPPSVYRVLDDAEDLNTVAERDVKLNGIGIKRTEDSIHEVYGDGYEIDRLSEEQKAANASALAAAKAVPGAPGARPAANDNPRAKIAAARAEFGVDDEAPLYVYRQLKPESARALIAWAESVGIKATVPAAEMHTTVLYSKRPVDWFSLGESWQPEVTVSKGGPRKIERLGDKGAVVLRFENSDMRYRHESMVERGASHDYDEFRIHLTLSYDVPADFDLDAIEPFTGELKFGPEMFERIKDKPFDPASLDFAADEEDAIDRLIAKLVEEADPVFAAMGDALKTSLQGVKTVEGARVAILEAFERMPVERLAELTALPMLAVRAGALAGAENDVKA
jgi:phage gp29-like protein